MLLEPYNFFSTKFVGYLYWNQFFQIQKRKLFHHIAAMFSIGPIGINGSDRAHGVYMPCSPAMRPSYLLPLSRSEGLRSRLSSSDKNPLSTRAVSHGLLKRRRPSCSRMMSPAWTKRSRLAIRVAPPHGPQSTALRLHITTVCPSFWACSTMQWRRRP